ncbi:MAG: hypothetical protein J5546_06040 [Lachnospiraceae bacterium]|nr:hypothetical protein [Lachnospiraceae bacterium]
MFFLAFLLAAVLLLGGCAGPMDIIQSESGSYAASLGSQGTEGKAQKTYDDAFCEKVPRYAYETLSDAQKLWYEDMEHILGSMESDGPLSKEGFAEGLSDPDIELIFQCVCIDHPEFFFVDGFSYVTYYLDEEIIGYDFSGHYSMDRREAAKKLLEIQEERQNVIVGWGTTASDQRDYGKVKYVYEYLIRNVEYDMEAPDNQNIYSALVRKRSVCQGYSKAVQYLLNGMGVECTLVQGEAFGQTHGWNLVKADDAYYYLDVTWGDNSYHPGGDDASPEILYDYFLVTTEEILKEHVITEIVPLPVCMSAADNYFVQENAYLLGADEEQLRSLFANATPENGWQVSLKCADETCFRDVKELLLGKNKIFDYYPGSNNKVAYYQNEELFCLTFWVTN